MKHIIKIILAISLTGCTINIIQTDTHGTASDVVDDTTKTSSTVDPELSYSR